jgi:hypothetical protein
MSSPEAEHEDRVLDGIEAGGCDVRVARKLFVDGGTLAADCAERGAK